jgi:hypothetical protein
MIAFGIALVCFMAGIALHRQADLVIVRAALYGVGAAGFAYWLLRRLPWRFSASSQPADLPARLVVLIGLPRHNGKVFPLRKLPQLLGKKALCCIEPALDGYRLTDRGAPHGIYLNGRRLVPNLPVSLHSGDEIAFGAPSNNTLVLRFYAELFPQAPKTPAETQRTAPTLETLEAQPDADRIQFFKEVQNVARRTSTLPLVLPSTAQQAPSESKRHDS